jgi:hypothetical protein
MFAGHGALALLAKARRPAVPFGVLAAAAYAPDWLELPFRLAALPQPTVGMWTHSILSVAIGSMVGALAWWLASRDRAGALLVGLAYASHWPADVLTGTLKPTWPGGPTFGVDLYQHSKVDFAVESLLVIAAWLVWTHVRPAMRRSLHAIPALAILLQLGFSVQDRLPFGDWKRGAMGLVATLLGDELPKQGGAQ